MPNIERTPGKRNQFWEPIFAPAPLEPFKSFDWDTSNVTGICKQTCTATNLKTRLGNRNSYSASDFRFCECDFRGDFDLKKITFKECVFEYCDLGYSTWSNVKFQKCTFRKCSLTMSTFEKCQFLDCTWADTGLSGNETRMSECLITNPRAFVISAYTNLDHTVLEKHNTTPSNQKMRLEQTKVKVARMVLTSLERNGDDRGYYEAVAMYLNQSLDADLAEARHKVASRNRYLSNRLRIVFLNLEKSILNASGFINSWGASIARPALFGVGLMVFFGLFYYFTNIECSIYGGLMASFDITTLVGYTKHAVKNGGVMKELSYATNMMFGLWWYAIFVPTVINRISRVRA